MCESETGDQSYKCETIHQYLQERPHKQSKKWYTPNWRIKHTLLHDDTLYIITYRLGRHSDWKPDHLLSGNIFIDPSGI